MSDEVTPSSAQGTENAQPSEAPEDFRAYAKWRATGELPEAKDEATPAAVEEDPPPAKTEPDSETEGQQAEDDEEEEDDSTTKPKGGGSRARKIDRLTREREQFARENEELKRQIAQQATPQDRPSGSAAAAAAMPEPSDFKSLAEYQIALTDWRIEQRERERQEAEQARQQAEAKAAAEETERKQLADWDKKLKAVKKAHPEFDAVLQSAQIRTGPAAMAIRQALLEDDHGAEIFYHLASNPKDFEKIMAMTPATAIITIGKMSSAFDQPSAAAENGKAKITGAPKPPPPSLRPGKVTSDAIDDPEVIKDFKRWARAREAQLGRK